MKITEYTVLAKIMEHQWKIEIMIQTNHYICLMFIYLKIKNSGVNINNNN